LGGGEVINLKSKKAVLRDLVTYLGKNFLYFEAMLKIVDSLSKHIFQYTKMYIFHNVFVQNLFNLAIPNFRTHTNDSLLQTTLKNKHFQKAVVTELVLQYFILKIFT
jgi:hypothetical protein